MGEVSNMSIESVSRHLVLVAPRDSENGVDNLMEDESSKSNETVEVEVASAMDPRLCPTTELHDENSKNKTQLFYLEEIVVPGKVEEIQKLLKRIVELEGRLSDTNGLYSDNQNALQVAKDSLQSVNEQNAQLQTQLASLQPRNEQLETEVITLNKKLEDLQKRFETQSQQLEEQQNIRLETESELNKLKVEYSRITTEKSEIDEKLLKSGNYLRNLVDENCAKEAELIEKIGKINLHTSEFRKLLLHNEEVLKKMIGEPETEHDQEKMLSNYDPMKRIIGESEAEGLDDQDNDNASIEAMDESSSDSNANTNQVEASTSRMTRSASSSSTRTWHRRYEQRKKPFPCTFANCGNSFSNLRSLRQHENAAHKVVLRKRKEERETEPQTHGVEIK